MRSKWWFRYCCSSLSNWIDISNKKQLVVLLVSIIIGLFTPLHSSGVFNNNRWTSIGRILYCLVAVVLVVMMLLVAVVLVDLFYHPGM